MGKNESPITCEQNRIGEILEKSTRASTGSCNIATYLYPKIYWCHSMEMSFFLSLAFTEILHLKNTWLIFFKWNNVVFEQLYLLEPSMWQYLFLINYKVIINTLHLHFKFVCIRQMLLSKATYSAFRLYILYQYVCSLGFKPTTFCAALPLLADVRDLALLHLPFEDAP